MKAKRHHRLLLLVLILTSILVSSTVSVGAYAGGSPGCYRYCPGDARR